MGLRDGAELALVTTYLVSSGVYLRARGRLRPAISLAHLALRAMQLRAAPVLGVREAELRQLRHERGHAYVGRLPLALAARSDAEGGSPLLLFEDGRPLGPAHAAPHEVVAGGGGRFYHWFGAVVFSTPDGSDPRTNGRRYVVLVKASEP